MPTRGSNSPWISPSGFMNAGSFAEPAGSPEPGGGTRFHGMLGRSVVYDRDAALKVSKTTVGTLYEGEYQLVKAVSTISRGEVVYWDTLANQGVRDFEVTHTVTAPAHFKAGIAVNDATSGEWTWIQIAGLASGKYHSALTDATLGNLVITQALNVAVLDALADAGAVATAGAFKQIVGWAYELPVISSIKLVLLNPAGFYRNIA